MGSLKKRLAGAVLMAVLVGSLGAGSAEAAGMLIAENGFGGQLVIEEHDVKVVINNGVAVTTVTQVFRNTERRTVEALYTFPVPKAASVSNFSMWIAGKEMIGEVVEKKRAREIYDSYKRVGRDPGLLEQTDYKTFEMRIFPIAARAAQKVQITYYQELDVDNDVATYAYPLASDTRKAVDPKVRGKFALTLEVKSAVPISSIESTSHPKDFAVAKHTPNYCQASMEASGGSLRRDLVLAYKLSRPQTGLDLVTSKHRGEDGYFCLTMTAGKELAAKQTGMDYVFVMDISGSMAAGGKLDTTRESVGAFIDVLGEKDNFEILTFNVQPKPVFKALAAASRPNKARALKELDMLRSSGGTTMVTAMQVAYRYAREGRTLNVVVLSDGLTEESERSELLAMIRRRPKRSRVFCVGVGNEVNKPLLRQMAADSGGLAAFVSKGDNLKRQARSFRRKLANPAATAVSIDFGGRKVYDVVPRKTPNLYHGQPIRIYGRYRGSGAFTCSVSATIEGKPFNQKAKLDFPASDADNPEIDRMWAWRRVQELLGDADRAGSRASFVDQVIALGEGYSIVTEYTSFIVLENDAEYRRWRIDRRNAIRVKRDRVAQARLRRKLDELRMQAASNLGPSPSEEKKPAPARAQSRPVAPVNARSFPSRQAQPAPAESRREPRRERRRRVNFSWPSFGIGAVDPFTAALAGGLILMAVVSGCVRRRREEEDE